MDKRPHPVLSQIPLIVTSRPPQSVTLPFNFNKLPSSLPATEVNETLDRVIQDSSLFVEASERRRKDRIGAYEEWKRNVDRREIEEKRRIAPGYLDSSNKILLPTRNQEPSQHEPAQDEQDKSNAQQSEISEIDKAFGRVEI
uniref:ARAD1C38302p n=1 Tax=Blastobotrys adeninivorans TaxID=409370 RepID=A0A060T3L7_BLAAD